MTAHAVWLQPKMSDASRGMHAGWDCADKCDARADHARRDCVGTTRVRAHDGHDHGAPPPPVSTTIAPRADASSADFELVVVARGDQLEIHLDSFKTNAPIANAEIEIDTPSGVLKAKAAPEAGLYAVAAPFLTRPGSYDLAFTVTSGDTVDILTASVKVPDIATAPGSAATGWSQWTPSAIISRVAGTGTQAATSGAAVAATRDVAQRFADGALFVPKPTQRILAVRTELTESARIAGRSSCRVASCPIPMPVDWCRRRSAGGSATARAASSRSAPPSRPAISWPMSCRRCRPPT